jgi:hypothetical protein
MKRNFYLFLLALGAITIVSCEKEEPCTITCQANEVKTADCTCECNLTCAADEVLTAQCTCVKGFVPPPPPKFTELTGNLTTQTLVASKMYLLKGQVFVNSGQTLTIEPGTIIAGDKATKGTLIISKGGKINAIGTKDKPIVMTSALDAGLRDRGDWGGLIILGNANVNQVGPAIEGVTPAVTFGTTDNTAQDTESSGTLKYVRVEFAGIELTPNNETNSITMGAVGSGTVMEYCQVTFGGDDGFEWFGGTINAKYLISVGSWDDCFDVDFGYSGNVQYGLSVRYPSFADQSGSNAFECDNGPNDNDVKPYTTGTFSNITCIGHRGTTGNSSNANYQHAMDLRRRTAVSIVNSVFIGWDRGLRFNQPSVLAQYQSGTGLLYNNVLVTPSGANQFLGGTGVNAADVAAYWNANNTVISSNPTVENVAALGLKNDFFFDRRDNRNYGSNPDFKLAAGTLNTASKFDKPKFDEAGRRAFFTASTFIGAFGSAEDWTDGWAEFNPIAKAY